MISRTAENLYRWPHQFATGGALEVRHEWSYFAFQIHNFRFRIVDIVFDFRFYLFSRRIRSGSLFLL